MSQIRTAVIYGSDREGRFCDTIVDWVTEQMRQRGIFTMDPVDPKSLHRAVWPGDDQLDGARLRQVIERADAFVVVTPEYNHGYPAALKRIIDGAYHEWQAKPAAFVSYGGASGGIRAVEQLRQVFAELHVVTLRDGVCFASPWESFDAQGQLAESAAAEKNMAVMLARLYWWASVLKEGRETVPYKEVAA